MATDLYIKSYPLTSTFRADENFTRLVRAVSAWSAFEGSWSIFRCGQGSLAEYEASLTGPFSSAELTRLMSKYPTGPRRWFSASSPFKLWRYHAGSRTFNKELASVEVTAWSPESPKVSLGDVRVEGDAQISTIAKPYWALLDETTIENGKIFNEHVAENLSALKDLFNNSAKTLGSRSLKLFVDEGWTFPWNSHFTYWDGYDAVVEDISVMVKLWESGSPYEDIPLVEFDPERHAFAFSTLRTPKQRRELWQALNDLLANAPRVSPKSIGDALLATELISERFDRGFSVHDGRYYLNAFVQNFYVNVLELA